MIMDLSSIVVNISLTVFLIIGLLIFIISNRQVDGKTNHYFIAYIGVVCLLLIFDAWEAYLITLPRTSEWRYFTSAMCYTLRAVAITVLNILLHSNSRGRVLLWIPPLVLALVAFTSKYTHWLFYFNDLNWWMAGPLRFLPHITSGLCVLILIVKTIKNQKQYKSEVNMLFAFIIIINVLATIIETKTPVRFLLTGTMMVSSVLYYSVINKDNEMLRTKKQEQELADSRIAIMLSQIQPHFLYNSLNSIRQLCKNDPIAAQTAIEDFATYLRGNLDSIKRNTPVPFTKELEHIRIYLSLEKMRFEDELQIIWSVETADFMLPALTVQPLVENAVKYGVGKKPCGGTVTIATMEKPDAYVITVRDDGVGYDPMETQDDGRTHIGIDNVRSRLAFMCGGTLRIETAPGMGTTATVRIPKEEQR
jgi:two-component system, LytTR family, sensor kinase